MFKIAHTQSAEDMENALQELAYSGYRPVGGISAVWRPDETRWNFYQLVEYVSR